MNDRLGVRAIDAGPLPTRYARGWHCLGLAEAFRQGGPHAVHVKIGVKSSAILFADMDKLLIGVMQAMMLFALVLAGRSMRFGHWYYGGVVAAGLLFLYQQWLIRNREPAGCLKGFLNNHYVGLAIFVGIFLQYLYG